MTTDERYIELLKHQHAQLHHMFREIRKKFHEAEDAINERIFAIPSKITEMNNFKFNPHVTITNYDYEKYKALEKFFEEIKDIVR